MEHLSHVLGPNLAVSRGDLNRPSLTLQTIRLPSQAERVAWLAAQLPKLPGSGIIYTLTVRDADQVADWLKSRGLNLASYSTEFVIPIRRPDRWCPITSRWGAQAARSTLRPLLTQVALDRPLGDSEFARHPPDQLVRVVRDLLPSRPDLFFSRQNSWKPLRCCIAAPAHRIRLYDQ